jgi:glyoxylase-like metal-dependent hydrolase (beta-lactamase superfamily II)/rhodanese-related sulfurtransferase
MPAAPEISPGQLESELRSGAGVTVVDVRDRDAFAGWHLDPGPGGRLANVPEAELEADPAAVAGLAAGPLRLICTAGNASRVGAGILAGLGVDAASVEGGMIGWSRLLVRGRVPTPGPAQVVQFRREARGCLSYLVACGGRSLVVDPAPEVAPYLDQARELGAPIAAVMDTHVHADHLSGARELAARAGADLHVSAAALARGIRDPQRFQPVEDGQLLELGDAELRVLALPGHTSDMIGLLVDGAALIAGDSLFADSVARPDLEAGDEGARAAARVLHATLHERVLSLPGDTLLLPCHYSGGRVGGPIAPTLADVRAGMPELDAPADDFVRAVLDSMPPRPANYLQIIEVNLGGGEDAEAAARLEVGANNCAVSRAT